MDVSARRRPLPTRLSLLFLVLPVIILVSACTPQPSGKLLPREEVLALNRPEAVPPYRLAPGDKIAIKFFFNKEINDEVTIRPDGKISLQLIDEIQAAGLTPDELDRKLTSAFASALQTSKVGYIIGIGDRLAIKSFYYDKLNEEVIVRPDGKISLQLIDEIQAAGLSTEQLDQNITNKLKKFIDQPDISVIVRDFRRPDLSVIVLESPAQRIYIGGEVKVPSVMPLHGNIGILDAVFQAGGSLETAHLENVALLRKSASGEAEIYSINLTDIMQGTSPNLLLRPYDIVYVPKTAMAQLESFIRMNIYKLIPPQLLFSFTYSLNPEVEIKNEK